MCVPILVDPLFNMGVAWLLINFKAYINLSFIKTFVFLLSCIPASENLMDSRSRIVENRYVKQYFLHKKPKLEQLNIQKSYYWKKNWQRHFTSVLSMAEKIKWLPLRENVHPHKLVELYWESHAHISSCSSFIHSIVSYNSPKKAATDEPKSVQKEMSVIKVHKRVHTSTTILAASSSSRRFRSERGTFSGDGLETWFDAGDGAAGAARLTLKEVKPSVFLQHGVRRPACMARHVLLDISSEDVLDLFLLESSLDNELIVTVYRTTCTQFSQ